jgi:hypothetical protein
VTLVGEISDPLSKSDYVAIVEAAREGYEGPFPTDAIEDLCEEFRHALIGVAFLDLVRQRRLVLAWSERRGEWIFRVRGA